jgi:hypothetical protein
MKKELTAIGLTLLIISLFIGFIMALVYSPLTTLCIVGLVFALMIYIIIRDEID